MGERSPYYYESGRADAAGLSRDQKRTALRVANVPEADFAELVESEHPATVTQLAAHGKKPTRSPAHLEGRDPEDFKIFTALQGGLRLFAELGAQSADRRRRTQVDLSTSWKPKEFGPFSTDGITTSSAFPGQLTWSRLHGSDLQIAV